MSDQRQSGDPFEDPLMQAIAVLLVVFALISVIGLGVIYLADSYAVPAWDERSVPPPTTL